MSIRWGAMVLFVCMLGICAAHGQIAPEIHPAAWARLDAELARTLDAAGRDAQIPIVIVLREQTSREAIAALDAPPGIARHAAVIDLLKTTAAASQGGVLAVLKKAESVGNAGRVTPLWISNVIAAEVTPAVLLELAAREDVARVRLDVRILRGDFLGARDRGPLMNEGTLAASAWKLEVPAYGPDRHAAATLARSVDNRRAEPGTLADIQCGLELAQAPRVWNDLGITGAGAVVCIIDSGCCIDHADIRDHVWTNPGEIPHNNIDDDGNGYVDDIHGWNFADGNNNLTDRDGHGTHVSGTAIGDGTNGRQTGMAPDADLMTLHCGAGDSFESTVWLAMQYAVDNGADIISGSIGLLHNRNPDRSTWRNVSDNTIAAGVVVIYAAGNAGDRYAPFDNVATPGDVPDVITVGATDCTGFYVKFSSFGPVTWQDVAPYNDWPYPPGLIKPTIAAAGNDVISTSNDCAGYTIMSGTSMATPHIAGAAALMISANPNLDHVTVKRILEETAVDKGDPGPDNIYGAGVVDAYAAVSASMGGLACDEVKKISAKCKQGKQQIVFKLKTKSRQELQPVVLSVTDPDGQSTEVESTLKSKKAKFKFKGGGRGEFSYRLINPRCKAFDGVVDC